MSYLMIQITGQIKPKWLILSVWVRFFELMENHKLKQIQAEQFAMENGWDGKK